MTYVFLAGASRGVGREVAKQLIVNGHQVLALLRSKQAEADLTAMGVKVVQGDALEADAMNQIMRDHPIEAVISTVGGLPESSAPRVDSVGNKNLIDAATAIKAHQFILVSSIGSGNSAGALPPNVLETLGPMLTEKAQAEEHLAKSGLTYTVIRPGGLVSEPATGKEVLTTDPMVAGSIPRAAVANLAIRCLGNDKAKNQVFSAIDLAMQRTEKEVEVVDL
ncbi:MAG: SDR family oxidoreductase [Cyanobacteria bacterium J06621_11]